MTASTSVICYIINQKSQPDACTFSIQIQTCGVYTNTSAHDLFVISKGELELTKQNSFSISVHIWSEHCYILIMFVAIIIYNTIFKLVPDPPELNSSPNYKQGNLVNIHTTLTQKMVRSIANNTDYKYHVSDMLTTSTYLHRAIFSTFLMVLMVLLFQT